MGDWTDSHQKWRWMRGGEIITDHRDGSNYQLWKREAAWEIFKRGKCTQVNGLPVLVRPKQKYIKTVRVLKQHKEETKEIS